ncbi:hypothetical protein [Pseudogemmobacter humi]|uniref:hypothetical protein n=1 Tax=Pseudogemmobacter humi TaxID=2483812 RepID=UPI000F54734E|nr:hypothetical protein [Pseudogemmobacter humi]
MANLSPGIVRTILLREGEAKRNSENLQIIGKRADANCKTAIQAAQEQPARGGAWEICQRGQL